MSSGPDDSKIVLPSGTASWGCMDSLNTRAMTGANAPKGCAGQESLSGEGIASGGQSVDLQSQTYDATCKTVAEARLTPSPFDVGVDHLHQNSTTTTAANATQPTRSHSSQRHRKTKQKKIKRLLLISNGNQETHHFKKFYSVKFPRLDLDTKLNVIATDKDLKTKIGKHFLSQNNNRWFRF